MELIFSGNRKICNVSFNLLDEEVFPNQENDEENGMVDKIKESFVKGNIFKTYSNFN